MKRDWRQTPGNWYGFFRYYVQLFPERDSVLGPKERALDLVLESAISDFGATAFGELMTRSRLSAKDLFTVLMVRGNNRAFCEHVDAEVERC